MSSPDPVGGGQNPFEGIFGDLARLLGSSATGPLNWDVARQVAVLIAGEGKEEPNADPLDRIRLEELCRVAELHVNQRDELSIVVGNVETMSHTAWAIKTLDDYRDMLERLAVGLSQTSAGPNADQLAQMQQWIAPLLLGMQVGGMVGHLARRTFGHYDLPIPRPLTSPATIVFVPANINELSTDWSLPLDELSLYTAIEEITRTAVLSRPHVAQRFTELITEYVSAFQPDSLELQERLSGLDISNPQELPMALTDPTALLGAIQTPAQQQTLAHLNALVAAFVGYVDHVVSAIATRTISSSSAIAEAVKRRRVEESDGSRLVERLVGLELAQPTFDRGHAFVSGVLERAGEEGLGRLWHSPHELPTPAEINAPGLWLERIDLPPLESI